MQKIFSFLVFFLITSSAYSDPKYLLYREHQNKLYELFGESFGVTIREENLLSPLLMVTANYGQKIDHKDLNNEARFKQRYWFNNTFAKGSNAPTLFSICGEGACSASSLYRLSKQAKALGANVVTLEHRYYGESQPFEDLTTDHLKFLTIENALKDLVNFKEFASSKYELSGDWVLIGGSYAGALAAYARSVYPKEFIGALASSAPVIADLNFDEYDEHVSSVAGPECVHAVLNVVEELERQIKTDQGFDAAKNEFDAEILNDRRDFLYLIADIGAAAIQYGMKDRFCALVIDQGRRGYVQAAKMVSGLFGNFANMSAKIGEDTSLKAHNGSIGIRQWFYQSCTEFGFWQNASLKPGKSARSKSIDPEYHQNLCHRLFNLNTSANVEETNAAYLVPTRRKENTNILFTNGSDDPWMKLSLVKKSMESPMLDHKLMVGAAHCDDLDPNASNADVIAGQELFLDLSKDWLKN